LNQREKVLRKEVKVKLLNPNSRQLKKSFFFFGGKLPFSLSITQLPAND
jgi:hypothetical protein